VPVNGALGLGALSLALAALGARRRKKIDDVK
jgi:LPXTG-motif cell wall-anchored protein